MSLICLDVHRVGELAGQLNQQTISNELETKRRFKEPGPGLESPAQLETGIPKAKLPLLDLSLSSTSLPSFQLLQTLRRLSTPMHP